MDVFQYIVVYNNFICLAERKQSTTDHHLTRPAMFNSSSPTVDSPHERQSGFRNLANFCSWIPESCAFESRIQFKESLPTIGIWNPSSTGKESEIQYLESTTYSVESRIHDRLGLPLLERIDEAEI